MKCFRKKKYVYFVLFKGDNEQLLSISTRVKASVSFYEWLHEQKQRADKELGNCVITNCSKIED